MTSKNRRGIGRWAAALGLLAVVSVATPLALADAPTPAPSRGPVPNSVFDGGAVDRSQIPDYIPASDQSGKQVGWVSSKLAIPQDGPITNLVDDIPVYADDLSTVVGDMIAGRGFVPKGTDPSSVPTIPVTVVQDPPASN